MGGTSSTTSNQQSQTSPYSAAAPVVNGALSGLNSQLPNAGLNSKQSGAIDTLESNAANGNPYAPAIGNVATGLLNGGGATNTNDMINAAYKQYSDIMNPTASGANIGKNSALQPQLDQIATDVTNNVNSQFAAAGRDGSPANTMALARGVAAGQAPVIAAQYNTDVANQNQAAGNILNAANTATGLLNSNQAAANTNAQAGVGVGSSALDANNYGANATLAAEAQRFGIPVSQYSTLLGATAPVAQAFGTNTGNSSGTSTMSGAQQFANIMSGIGNGVSAWTGKNGTGLRGLLFG